MRREPPSAERHARWCERDLIVTYSIGRPFLNVSLTRGPHYPAHMVLFSFVDEIQSHVELVPVASSAVVLVDKFLKAVEFVDSHKNLFASFSMSWMSFFSSSFGIRASFL